MEDQALVHAENIGHTDVRANGKVWVVEVIQCIDFYEFTEFPVDQLELLVDEIEKRDGSASIIDEPLWYDEKHRWHLDSEEKAKRVVKAIRENYKELYVHHYCTEIE